MPVVVRPVQPDEHAEVADLTASVYRGGGFSSADYEPALRDVDGRVATASVLVAVADGRIVGTVTVSTRGGPWAEQSGPGEAEVRMLAVDPAARGEGAGLALMLACLDAARRDGCARVRLSSQEDMLAAHRLYDRLGFIRTPERDWSPTPGLRLRTYELAL